ncbi:UNVERIFIED_CONTAM: hypothetical protein HDU68_005587 [Siphonaria sp. JEL0065]|nr:hypothetical protein HDU68_005587 [Siphonaria sp. JEL0065]
MGFTGDLPNLAEWSSLRAVNFANNEFSSEVPAFYTKNKFTSLDLSFNCLEATSSFATKSHALSIDYNIASNHINSACARAILGRRDVATDANTDAPNDNIATTDANLNGNNDVATTDAANGGNAATTDIDLNGNNGVNGATTEPAANAATGTAAATQAQATTAVATQQAATTAAATQAQATTAAATQQQAATTAAATQAQATTAAATQAQATTAADTQQAATTAAATQEAPATTVSATQQAATTAAATQEAPTTTAAASQAQATTAAASQQAATTAAATQEPATGTAAPATTVVVVAATTAAATTTVEVDLDLNVNNGVNSATSTFAAAPSPSPVYNEQCLTVVNSFPDVKDPEFKIDCANIVNNTRYTWGWQPPALAVATTTVPVANNNAFFKRRHAKRALARRTSSASSYVVLSLSLSGLKITGAIPVALATLSSVQKLDFSGNKFSGEIPDIFKSMPALSEVNLSGNSGLQGNLTQLFVSVPLKSLSVAGTTIKVPDAIIAVLLKYGGEEAVKTALNTALNADCLTLNAAFAGYNATGGTSVTDVLDQDCSSPHNNTRVAYLVGPALSSNYTAPTVKTTTARATTARATTTSHVGASFFRKRRALSRRATDYNRLRIFSLSVSGLGISGPVPSALGNFGYLESLDISDNNFSGAVPDSFNNLSKLKSFKFTGTLIKGKLPSGLLEIIAANGGTVDFGTLCLDENPNRICPPADFPTPKIDCFQLSRDKTYVESVYDPLWQVGKLSDYASFKEHWDATKGGYFLGTEWQYNSFKSYYRKVKWCEKNFPVYQYWTYKRLHPDAAPVYKGDTDKDGQRRRQVR